MLSAKHIALVYLKLKAFNRFEVRFLFIDFKMFSRFVQATGKSRAQTGAKMDAKSFS